MKLKIIFSLMFLCLLSSSALHPINMTVSNITFADKKMHLKVKFFADDLQGTLSQFGKVPVDIITKGIDGKTEKCLQRYVAAKFEMSVNAIPVKWSYKKAYLKEDVLFVEYQSALNDVKNVKTVRIMDILQFEDFPEQKNIVNINLFNENKILIFDNGSENTKEISF